MIYIDNPNFSSVAEKHGQKGRLYVGGLFPSIPSNGAELNQFRGQGNWRLRRPRRIPVAVLAFRATLWNTWLSLIPAMPTFRI